MVRVVPPEVSLSSDEEEESIEVNKSEEEQPKKGRKRGSKVKDVSAKQSPKKTKPSSGRGSLKIISGPVLTLDEMVQNTLIYLLLMQHKKAPVKRSEIVKHAMNGQLNSFPEVMDKIKEILDEKFGINLIGIEESRGRIKGYSTYILVSAFPMEVTESAAARNLEIDTKRSILYLILSVSFMLGRSLEEDLIWKIMSELQLDQLVCKKRDDLHRFLKQEYVSTIYLNVEEIKDSEQIEYRYSWGYRSDKEFSKNAILKFVAQQFPGRQASDFKAQYAIVQEQEQIIDDEDVTGTNSTRHDEEDLEIEDLPSQSMNYRRDVANAETFHFMSSRSTRDALITPPLPEDMDTDSEDDS